MGVEDELWYCWHSDDYQMAKLWLTTVLSSIAFCICIALVLYNCYILLGLSKLSIQHKIKPSFRILIFVTLALFVCVVILSFIAHIFELKSMTMAVTVNAEDIDADSDINRCCYGSCRPLRRAMVYIYNISAPLWFTAQLTLYYLIIARLCTMLDETPFTISLPTRVIIGVMSFPVLGILVFAYIFTFEDLSNPLHDAWISDMEKIIFYIFLFAMCAFCAFLTLIFASQLYRIVAYRRRHSINNSITPVSIKPRGRILSHPTSRRTSIVEIQNDQSRLKMVRIVTKTVMLSILSIVMTTITDIFAGKAMLTSFEHNTISLLGVGSMITSVCVFLNTTYAENEYRKYCFYCHRGCEKMCNKTVICCNKYSPITPTNDGTAQSAYQRL